MYGARSPDEQLDPFGLEVPFLERPDGSAESFPGASLDLAEETFVRAPDETGGSAGEGLSWLETAVQLAEAEASGDSAAEWLETEWLDTAGGDGESVEAFAERLGAEWSRRRGGDPTPEAMKAWLIQDHADTLQGARLRWPRQKTVATFWPRITAAWQVCREENMRFQTEPGQGIAALGAFAPPSTSVDLVSDPIVGGSDKAPIAPLTLRFARELRRRMRGVSLSNYRGHGGGAFLDRGYSLDLFLPKRDGRGFYLPEDATRLLRAVNAAAHAVGADWRAIYNDHSVAAAINAEFRRRHVIFVGGVRRNKAKQVTGLNWHGPDPLILHVHLDLAPRSGAALGEAEAVGMGEAPQVCAACGGSHVATPRAEALQFTEAEDHPAHEMEGSDTREGPATEGEWESAGGRYDAPETGAEGFDEDAREAGYGGEDEASGMDSAGLSPAERKALEITSTLETGKRGGFFGLRGNFDGQGLSFGLVNWTIGTGSLQPLLRDFAREQPQRWAAIFGPEAERFRHTILPKGAAAVRAQLRFAVDEMNAVDVVRGRKRWAIREPWRTAFLRLSEDPAFRAIQIRYVRDLLNRAADFCRLFKLTSERAFAFMFDAVSSHGKWWLTKRIGGVEKRRLLLEPRLRILQSATGGRTPEREVLLAIADVLAETSAPRWADKVLVRKRWFVTGEHPRARELAGLNPRADLPWTVSSSGPHNETHRDLGAEGPDHEAEWMETGGEPQRRRDADGEDLAWLDYEGPHDEAEWTGQEAEGREPLSEDEAGRADHEDAVAGQRLEGALLEALESAQPFGVLETFEAEGSGAQACPPYPAGYEKLIRRRGSKDGEVADRTQGDRTTNLSLQFRDYDVNAYLAGEKSSHAAGLATITEFINARIVAGADVEVTITGSASRTGTRQFNQDLSEKRARCMAQMLRASLVGAAQARTRFNEHGEGFEKATCQGADCELPGFRSVLVSVHSPNRPPPPVPPEPDTWDRYEMRCCAFQSLALGEVALDELLKRLPGGLPRAVAERLAPILRKRLEALLKRLLGRLPKLAALGGEVSTLLKFLPVEITRQKAVFQVRERGKPNPRLITLCYDGFGGRLALPIPGALDDALDELLKKVPGVGGNDFLRGRLKALMREELETLLPKALTRLMAKLDSNVPGRWKPFDLNRRERLEVFRGPADIFVDVITNIPEPGQLTLAFDGPRWNNLDRARRVAIKLPDGGETSVMVLQVDGGVGFDLLSVNRGELVDRGCACAIEGQTEVFELADFA